MGKEHQLHTWNLIAKKLSGEATPEELQELESLMRSNPDLHYPMQTVSDLWNAKGPADLKGPEQAFRRHLERMEALNPAQGPDDLHRPDPGPEGVISVARSRTRFRNRLLLAGACGCLALAALFLYPGIARKTLIPAQQPAAAPDISSEVSTRNGSKTNLVLPDGTLVWLNAGSRITYDKSFANTLREVRLSGEAFFDVAKNPDKPFVIHTDRIDIRVLGTRFNVKSYAGDRTTEATLIKGSVEISIRDRPSEKIILKPNEKIVVANDDSTRQVSKVHHDAVTADRPLVAIRKATFEPVTGENIETSWVENKFIFQDEEFGELAAQMERWYGVTIMFADPALKTLRFTGSFRNETIQQALDALKLTAAFTYNIRNNQVTLFNK